MIGGSASLIAITEKEVSVIIASPMAMTVRNGFTFAAAWSRRRISFDPPRTAGAIDSPLCLWPFAPSFAARGAVPGQLDRKIRPNFAGDLGTARLTQIYAISDFWDLQSPEVYDRSSPYARPTFDQLIAAMNVST